MSKILLELLMLLSKNKQINFRRNLYLLEEIYLKMTAHLRFNLQLERWVEELEVYCKEANKNKDNNRREGLPRYQERSSRVRRDYLQLNRTH